MSGGAVEFSRPVPLARLGNGTFRQQIAATPAERAALARRFQLLSLEHLTAEVEIVRHGPDTFLLRALFDAAFEQECVVTLDPVAGTVREEFALLYGPPEAEPSESSDEDFAFEPIVGDAIDIGEAVAQEFSLALPPFPRAPGASVETEASSKVAEPTSPFAALSQLVDRKGG
jgi:uncharacterized metal-binding protein YceD (DUF177 family)